MIKLTKKDREKIYELADRWEVVVEQYEAGQFDYDGYKIIAKDTFSYLERYFVEDVLPMTLVYLLLRINEFAFHPLYISDVGDAAQRVASTFCDVINLFGISGDNYELCPQGKREFIVLGATKYHRIDASTFELTELIDDL